MFYLKRNVSFQYIERPKEFLQRVIYMCLRFIGIADKKQMEKFFETDLFKEHLVTLRTKLNIKFYYPKYLHGREEEFKHFFELRLKSFSVYTKPNDVEIIIEDTTVYIYLWYDAMIVDRKRLDFIVNKIYENFKIVKDDTCRLKRKIFSHNKI